MSNNTKARHLEIYTAAAAAIEAAGGVEKIDKLPELERITTLKNLYKQVETAADCHKETARKVVARAMRKARYGLMVAHGWGGARSGPHTGRPKKTIE